jgi:hypothetical protein
MDIDYKAPIAGCSLLEERKNAYKNRKTSYQNLRIA